MNIIGKTRDGFLCNLNRNEILFICYGDRYKTGIEESSLLGKEVKLNELFEKCREIENFKRKSLYESARGQLEKLLESLTKIEKFVAKIPDTID